MRNGFYQQVRMEIHAGPVSYQKVSKKFAVVLKVSTFDKRNLKIMTKGQAIAEILQIRKEQRDINMSIGLRMLGNMRVNRLKTKFKIEG